MVPAETIRSEDDAPVLKLLQGGKTAEDKTWADDDAPVIRSTPKAMKAIPSGNPPIRQVVMREVESEEREMSIANVFRSTQKASKAIRRASSAWYQEG